MHSVALKKKKKRGQFSIPTQPHSLIFDTGRQWGNLAGILNRATPPAPHWGILGIGSTPEPRPGPSLGDSGQGTKLGYSSSPQWVDLRYMCEISPPDISVSF